MKINRSQIMKRAHELAKKMVGDWYARLALALRQAWMEAKKMADKIVETANLIGKKIKADRTGREVIGTVVKYVDLVGGKGVALKDVTLAGKPFPKDGLPVILKDVLEVLE